MRRHLSGHPNNYRLEDAVTSILQDVRFGARMLAKSPGLAAVAIITLALGIGANTAAFSMVRHLLLTPLPYDEPERLVALSSVDLTTGEESGMSLPDLEDVREQGRAFEAVAAVQQRPLVLDAGGGPEQVEGVAVTPDFLTLLRVAPEAGRGITREDTLEAQPAVALLGHGFWQRRFGADPSVVGREVTVDRRPVTVVGVLPADLQFPSRQVDLWVPLPRQGAHAERDGRHLTAIARLAPGVDLAQAREEMGVLASRFRDAYANTNANVGFSATRLEDRMVAKARQRLLLLQGAVAFVLLIACANVANLFLARGSARAREVAIRAALGAGRWRLVQQFLAESLLLALAGGALGLFVGRWLLDLLIAAGPERIARLNEIKIDGSVLAFTLGVSALTGVLFGLVPALRAAATDAADTLKQGGTAAAGFGRDRLRAALLVGEVALSLILLVGAGLLTRAYWRLENVAPGFEPSGALTVSLALPEAMYPEHAQTEEFYRAVLDRVRHVPGVEAAGAVDIMPLVGWNPGAKFVVEGREASPDVPPHRADFQPVTPEYFRAMGIPVLQGRPFAGAELAGDAPVVVVNDRFARRIWPEEDAVGKRIRFADGADSPWLTVVGVVGDVRQFGVQEEPRPEIYVPEVRRTMTLVARTSVPPAAVTDAVLGEIRAVDPTLPRPAVRTLEEVLDDSLSTKRLASITFGTLAVVAVLLATIGIYGVISFSVARRTREIGIRMALGAAPRDVAGLVVGQCLGLTAVGVGVGLCGALAVTRLLRSYLYGVSALDPLTFVAAALLLVVAALAASWAPLLAATRLNPVTALRHE
jgi:putative ABC transport system permease protein